MKTTEDELRERVAFLEHQLDLWMCYGLTSFADDDMDDERTTAFRSHLAKCETCQRDLVKIRQFDEKIRKMKELRGLKR